MLLRSQDPVRSLVAGTFLCEIAVIRRLHLSPSSCTARWTRCLLRAAILRGLGFIDDFHLIIQGGSLFEVPTLAARGGNQPGGEPIPLADGFSLPTGYEHILDHIIGIGWANSDLSAME